VNVDVSVPPQGPVSVADVVSRLARAASYPPFAPDLLAFVAALSRRISQDAEARRSPELQSLAFWSRKSSLEIMRAEFERQQRPDVLRVPRGLVLHVPPANVDTMFVYSWLLAVLTGNRNIVRLSSRVSPLQSVLKRIVSEALEADAAPPMRDGHLMVSYGHDAAITQALSEAADVRMIWGGDATVSAIRAVPARPRTRDVAFADRFSFAIVGAPEYNAASDQERAEIARAFFNDVYWFSQAGCSSPRLLIWRGDEAVAERAAAGFASALRSELDRRAFAIDTGATLTKLTFAQRAVLDRPVTRYEWSGNELAVLTLGSLEAFDRQHCGFGLLFQHRVSTLDDLVPFVADADQTVAYHGIGAGEIRDFARALNGKGIDRFVPVGRALEFAPVWDGYDLFHELTRHVAVPD
jgi:hypothetical protein